MYMVRNGRMSWVDRLLLLFFLFFFFWMRDRLEVLFGWGDGVVSRQFFLSKDYEVVTFGGWGRRGKCGEDGEGIDVCYLVTMHAKG